VSTHQKLDTNRKTERKYVPQSESNIVTQLRLGADVYSRHARYREILLVFIKYGFGSFIHLGYFQALLGITSKQPANQEVISKSRAVRLRLALEELGPTFVKFGQILSSRRDIVSDDIYEELQKLQDQVPPVSASKAKAVIEEELGKKIHDLFKTFEDEPIAAASIAQVHRATLKDGQVVAIKVQRPNILNTIQADLHILANLARLIEKYAEELSVLDPQGIVHEFSKTLIDELDFTNEAQNMERFSRQFRKNRHIQVPALFKEYSTSRIITMEYMKGYRINEPQILRKHDIDPVKLSQDVSKLIYKQMFEYGFFHGDPHPGNITILEGGVTGLYDYGMMGVLSPQFRTHIANMMLGLAKKDQHLVVLALLGMSEKGYVKDGRKLEADTGVFVEQYLNKPVGELKLGFILNRLLDVLREHELRMKPSFYLGTKALSQVEDIAKDLNPNLNFVELGRPFAQRAIESKYDWKQFKNYLEKTWTSSLDILEQLPGDLKDFYERLKAGNHILPIEHRINPEGFEPLRSTMNHIANRLTHAILAASVLISSSIMVLANIRPKWNDIPILGLIGFLVGILMAFRLFLSIWKRGGF
jgi:ubiquinone biosynthesis protein